MPRYYEGTLVSPDGRFAICVCRFNGFITEELLKGAVDALVRHGVEDGAIDVFRCPGAFDLPGIARRVVDQGQYDGVICLGAVIRGGTPHFDYVCSEVSKGIGRLVMDAPCAVTFGVLTCDTVEQAIDRAGTKSGNKGAEAAVACIEMVSLNRRLASMKGKKK